MNFTLGQTESNDPYSAEADCEVVPALRISWYLVLIATIRHHVLAEYRLIVPFYKELFPPLATKYSQYCEYLKLFAVILFSLINRKNKSMMRGNPRFV